MPSRDGVLTPPQSMPVLLQVLLLHVAAWVAVIVLASGMAWLNYSIELTGLALLQGAAAWGLSKRLRLPGWWRLINLGFFPTVWLALQFELSPAWYLAGFALLALTQWGAVRTRVPLYLSGLRAQEEVARRLAALPSGKRARAGSALGRVSPKRADAGSDFRRVSPKFLDLGCGTGSMLAYLAQSVKQAQLYGIETAPLLWLASRLRLGRRAVIRLADLWDEDLSRYDMVYAFLSPAPMTRLWQKAQREMRPGTVFISNSFAVPGVEPDESVELNDGRQTRLLIWRMR